MADHTTSDRHRTSREKVQVSTNMPMTTQRKQTTEVRIWIQPTMDCEYTSALLSMRSVGKMATTTAPHP
jgi:hypothetical protein